VFPADALDGVGVIGGTPVACLSVAGQIAAHTGYDLPDHHVADLAKLQGQDRRQVR
jgi:hypothetical protein